jgi:hypothetical protein
LIEPSHGRTDKVANVSTPPKIRLTMVISPLSPRTD